MNKLIAPMMLAGLFSAPVLADSMESLIDEAYSLASIGFDMAEYGTSQNTDDVVQCMDMMREHQPKADELRSQIAALPFSVAQSNLEMATIDLRRCLSCIPDAVSSCEEAEKLIDTAEQYL